MEDPNDLSDLDADLEGQKAAVVRDRTNVILCRKLKEKIKITYPNRSLGSVLEEGAMLKLRRDGHVPAIPQKGAEPANMESYLATKKVALEEIKERVDKAAPKKPKL